MNTGIKINVFNSTCLYNQLLKDIKKILTFSNTHDVTEHDRREKDWIYRYMFELKIAMKYKVYRICFYYISAIYIIFTYLCFAI